MHYYSHNIGDFRSGTIHLNRMERAIYRELLDICYDTELPLPLSKETLYRKISAKTDEERAIVDQLLSEFFSEEGDGYHNARVDKEISAYRSKADAARENGRLGGRPKASQENIANKTKQVDSLKSKETDEVILANPELTESKANQETINNNHKPLTKEKTKAPAGADMFAGVDPQVVSDFKSMRKSIKAEITKTAMDGIIRESKKAGITLESALRMCCERSWRSFKADWITQPARGSPMKPEKFNPTEYVNRNRSEKNERDIKFDAEGNPV